MTTVAPSHRITFPTATHAPAKSASPQSWLKQQQAMFMTTVGTIKSHLIKNRVNQHKRSLLTAGVSDLQNQIYIEKLAPFIEVFDAQPKVNFREVWTLLARIKAAHCGSSVLRDQFPNTYYFAYLRGYNDSEPGQLRLGLFIENDCNLKRTIITVTDDDSWRDRMGESAARYDFDRHIGINVHDKFNKDAVILFNTIKNNLHKNTSIVITGHSNGGALANIIQLHLTAAGYENVTAITFGQPKTISDKHAHRYARVPFIRVINQNDPVPRIFPARLSNLMRGAYRHVGVEVLLGPKQQFVLLNATESKKVDLNLPAKSLSKQSVARHHLNDYCSAIVNMPLYSYSQPPALSRFFSRAISFNPHSMRNRRFNVAEVFKQKQHKKNRESFPLHKQGSKLFISV